MKGDLYLLISLSPYFLISLSPYLPIPPPTASAKGNAARKRVVQGKQAATRSEIL